jgi:ADP-heptose:LPS heptosyltransferase
MASRFLTRALVVARALPRSLSRSRPRGAPASVLIAHHPKMIGDTLLMTTIAAKARHAWPGARIVMTASPATQPLFAARPWGLETFAFDPADASSLAAYRQPGGYDLAIVPGDNRYGWFARALGAKWVVGFSGDRPRYKDWLLDERRPYPDKPGVWHDMAADLIPGEDPPPYDPAQWPAPAFKPFELPAGPYAVIHLGASSVLKQWRPERWAEVAAWLEARGLEVVWSAGRGEEKLVRAIDPEARRRSYAGALDLAQVWHLLARAQLLVTPDTGLSHLARITGTPSVTLFGPGTPQLMGSGRFFRNAPWKAVIVDPFPCRDQPILYKRQVTWVRRCARTTRECASPACMHAIEVRDVIAAIRELRPRLR